MVSEVAIVDCVELKFKPGGRTAYGGGQCISAHKRTQLYYLHSHFPTHSPPTPTNP
jgi:hypothetical protein